MILARYDDISGSSEEWAFAHADPSSPTMRHQATTSFSSSGLISSLVTLGFPTPRSQPEALNRLQIRRRADPPLRSPLSRLQRRDSRTPDPPPPAGVPPCRALCLLPAASPRRRSRSRSDAASLRRRSRAAPPDLPPDSHRLEVRPSHPLRGSQLPRSPSSTLESQRHRHIPSVHCVIAAGPPPYGQRIFHFFSSPGYISRTSHITDSRMSLLTIARQLYCSRPSSASRLSVVWTHLYCTEPAKDTGAKKYKYPEVYDPYGPMPPPSEKVVDLADRIAALPPEEIKQIAPALLLRLNQQPPQAISGQGFSFGPQGGAGPGAAKAEEKAEKTVFDVKLEKFEAAAKIKIIKEIRTFTDLGLKEAKELVEKTPVILKQSLTKEEAEAIIEKIKSAGGVAVME